MISQQSLVHKMQKQGAAFPIKIIVVILLILIILIILLLFVTGTYREVFSVISSYLNIAKEGAAGLPNPNP